MEHIRPESVDGDGINLLLQSHCKGPISESVAMSVVKLIAFGTVYGSV
jgi:hypothetical protein